jgi:hypothetical protein
MFKIEPKVYFNKMGLKGSQAVKSETQDNDNRNKSANNSNKYKFKKIIVSKNYELENGILGLDRDNYLSIVKFLDSSILRKV